MGLLSRSKTVLVFCCSIGCLFAFFQVQGCTPTTPLQETTSDASPSSDKQTDKTLTDKAALIDCAECTVFTGGLLFDGESFVEGTLVVKGRTIQKLLRGQVTVKAGKVIDIKKAGKRAA